jgi:hypothetical protein
MKFTPQELASFGRYGDTELLHVSKKELAALRGIGSLHGAAMTRNPVTGLPEAFNFSSLIPAIVGIGATVMSGGTLSPLMAGMISGATTTAVTGDIRKGLMSGISGGAMAGLGQGIAALGTPAAGEAASMMGAEAAGMAGADAAGAAGLDAAGLAGADAAGAGAQAFSVPPPDVSLGGASGLGMDGGMDAAAYTPDLGTPALGAQSAPAAGAGEYAMDGVPYFDGADAGAGEYAMDGVPYTAASAPTQPGFSGATFMNNVTDGDKLAEQFGGKHFMSRTVPGGIALMNSVGGAFTPEPGQLPQRDKASDNAKREKFGKRRYTPHEDPYYAENGPGEPDMFSDLTFAEGGITSLPSTESPEKKAIRLLRSRYRSKKAAVEDMKVRGSVIDRLGIRDPNDPLLQFAFGFTEKQGKNAEPQQRMVAPQMMANGGIIARPRSDRMANDDDERNWDRLEFSAYGRADDPNKMYLQGETVNRKSGKIVDPDTMRSREYEVNDPRVLQRAAESFNRRRVKKMADGGMPGDGMSDSIPAMIEGTAPARLSRDEFVVPADVVSGLGNGSSQAGGEALHAMMARVRKARTGTTQQAPQIDPNQFLPA